MADEDKIRELEPMSVEDAIKRVRRTFHKRLHLGFTVDVAVDKPSETPDARWTWPSYQSLSLTKPQMLKVLEDIRRSDALRREKGRERLLMRLSESDHILWVR
jgi:hypothetical protein